MSERDDKAVLGTAGFYTLLLAIPLGLYFGLFGLIVLDELVLKTYWLTKTLPDSAVEILEVIYDPLIKLFRQ